MELYNHIFNFFNIPGGTLKRENEDLAKLNTHTHVIKSGFEHSFVTISHLFNMFRGQNSDTKLMLPGIDLEEY